MMNTVRMISLILLGMYSMSACAFITSAAGSLVGNIGADIVKEKGIFKEAEEKKADD
tara:strand:- start:170 stop:340 length:171 start_codon:yes stop_codon:yes gene_type:complete